MQYWYKIHKWTSLICAVFLLLMCASALPLIFGRELTAFNQVSVPVLPESAPVGAMNPPLSELAEKSLARYPGYSLRSVYLDQEKQSAGFSLQAAGKGYRYARMDLRSGGFIEQADQQIKYEAIPKLMSFMYRMHVDMYLGSFGRNLYGFMCGLSVVALLSGLWLYAPFMRTIPFGAIRPAPRRSCWMDWHKMLGIVTLCWAVLLCLSGFIFVFAGPIHNAWNESLRQEFLAQYQGRPSPAQRITVDAVLESVQDALPDRRITGIEFPQDAGKMPWHYIVRTKGEGIFAQLNQPVWVDASTGAVTAIIEQPWYMQGISLAGPVHFNNHDTLPLKVLWFVTDALTCIMIVTGIYAWATKFRPARAAAVQNQTRTVRLVRQSNRQIWLLPAAIMVLSLFGLLVPLAGSQWNTAAAAALAIPFILTVYYWLRR